MQPALLIGPEQRPSPLRWVSPGELSNTSRKHGVRMSHAFARSPASAVVKSKSCSWPPPWLAAISAWEDIRGTTWGADTGGWARPTGSSRWPTWAHGPIRAGDPRSVAAAGASRVPGSRRSLARLSSGGHSASARCRPAAVQPLSLACWCARLPRNPSGTERTPDRSRLGAGNTVRPRRL